MANKRRPCPRGLYNGCPIPRELCGEDYRRTGQWHCVKFLKEFEWFVFGTGDGPAETEALAGEEIVSLEDLMRLLKGLDGEA